MNLPQNASSSKRLLVLVVFIIALLILVVFLQFGNNNSNNTNKSSSSSSQKMVSQNQRNVHHDDNDDLPKQRREDSSPNGKEILALMKKHNHRYPKDRIIEYREDDANNNNVEKKELVGLKTIAPPPPQPETPTSLSPPTSSIKKKKAGTATAKTIVPTLKQMRKDFIQMMPSLKEKNALSVNFSDPYFDSPNVTCNPRVGGALLPPAPCTKSNPCRNVITKLHSTGWFKLTFPSFAHSKTKMKCAGFVCAVDEKDEDDYCAFLERGFVEAVEAAQRQAPSATELARLKAKRNKFMLAIAGNRQQEARLNKLNMTELELSKKQENLEAIIKKGKTIYDKFDFIDDGEFESVQVDNPWFPEAGTRHFCPYFPPPKTMMNINTKPPLIITLPASGGDAPSLAYSATNLRLFAERHQFALATVQPLNRHWHPSGWVGPGESGQKNDDIFRNFTHNDDIKFLDKIIDTLVESGKVDPKRIYLLGVSNGLMMASFYGIMRSGSRDAGALLNNAQNQAERDHLQKLYTGKTPGGNVVVAVAGFSGGDPFKGVGWSERCQTKPAPKSDLPFFVVSRLCDIVPCKWVREWIDRLVNEIGSREVRWTLLDSEDNVRTTDYCSQRNRKKYCEPVDDMMGHMHMPQKYLKEAIDFLLKF